MDSKMNENYSKFLLQQGPRLRIQDGTKPGYNTQAV